MPNIIRRVSLDVCGVLPTSAESEQFIADADPAKREKLVDQLLARKEFVELWVMKWSELLQMRSSISRQLQGDAPVLQLAAGANRRQRADRSDGQEAAQLRRRHVQQSGHELLPGWSRTG